jgi:di/tricarboxylate transporter
MALNLPIIITLTILLAAIALFVTTRLHMDLVALLVLTSLALAGLVTPAEALSGFSNLAVITVWAMFILNAGLSRTGVANIVGRQMLRLVGQGEIGLLTVLGIARQGFTRLMPEPNRNIARWRRTPGAGQIGGSA